MSNNVLFFIDKETLLAKASFINVVSQENAEALLEWGMSVLFPQLKEEGLRGLVIDFSEVTSFASGAMPTAFDVADEMINESNASNIGYDRLPIALVVSSTRQETTIRTFMFGASQFRTVVRSIDDAISFINNCNLQEGRIFDLPEDKLNESPKLRDL